MHNFAQIHIITDSKNICRRYKDLAEKQWDLLAIKRQSYCPEETRLWRRVAETAEALQNVKVSHIRAHSTVVDTYLGALNDEADRVAKKACQDQIQQISRDAGESLERS